MRNCEFFVTTIRAITNYECMDNRAIVYCESFFATKKMEITLEGEIIKYIWMEPNVDKLVRDQFQTYQKGIDYIAYAKKNLKPVTSW